MRKFHGIIFLCSRHIVGGGGGRGAAVAASWYFLHFLNPGHIFLRKLPRYLLKFGMKSHARNLYRGQSTKFQETFAVFDKVRKSLFRQGLPPLTLS